MKKDNNLQSYSFEEMVEILEPSKLIPRQYKQHRLIPSLLACQLNLLEKFSNVFASSELEDNLRAVIDKEVKAIEKLHGEPLKRIPADLDGKYTSRHPYIGKNDEVSYTYAILTPTADISDEPILKSAFRMMTLIVALKTGNRIPNSKAKSIISLLDKPDHVFEALLPIPFNSNIEITATSIRNYLNSNPNKLSKNRIASISWLLENIEKHTLQKKKNTNNSTISILWPPRRPTFSVNYNFIDGDNPVVKPSNTRLPVTFEDPEGIAPGLALDDVMESPPLIQGANTKIDEIPLFSNLEKARTNRGYEIWLAKFLQRHSDITLTNIEMVSVIGILVEIANIQSSTTEKIRAEAAISILLIILTSQSVRYIVNLPNLDDYEDDVIISDEMAEGISIRNGIHLFRIPDSEGFWKEDIAASEILVKTSNRVQLFLPDQVTAIMNKLHSAKSKYQTGRIFETSPGRLTAEIKNISEEIRKNFNMPRFTFERARQFFPVNLFFLRQDLAYVQMITGQSWGFSTASCHYVCVSEKELQTEYNLISTQLFTKQTPNNKTYSFRYELPHFCGSHMQVNDDELRKFVTDLRLNARQHKHSRKNISQWVFNFNAYTKYLAYMILAATAHRDSSALSRLRLTDFHTESKLALLADKITDPGQRARLVAIPSILADQIDRYTAECFELAKALKKLPNNQLRKYFRIKYKLGVAQLIKTLEDASTGAGPLLVRFTNNLKPAPVNNKWLGNALPKHWSIRLNFLRHRFATKLRAQLNSKQPIYIQLGHFSSGVQPFGRSGILNPDNFVHQISDAINQMFLDDGWKCIGRKSGTVITGQGSVFWHSSFNFRKTYQDIIKEERQTFLKNLKQRAIRCNYAHKDIAAATHSAIGIIVPDYSTENPPKNIKLSADNLEEISAVLYETVHDDNEQIEWCGDVLRSTLRTLRDKHSWLVEIPSRLYRPYIEPSPFFTGALSGLKCLQNLQRWIVYDFPDYNIFITKINLNSTKPSIAEYKLLKLACFLLFVEGFFNIQRLLSLIEGLRKTVRAKQLPSILFTPRIIKHKGEFVAEVGEPLSGITAIVAADSLNSLPHEEKTPTLKNLNDWLFAILPQEMRPRSKTKCWELMSDISAVGRKFQTSGMKHAIESGEMLTLNLPANRLVEFADQLSGQIVKSDDTVDSEETESLEPLSDVAEYIHTKWTGSLSNIQQYNFLTSTLHYSDDHEKFLSITDENVTDKVEGEIVSKVKNELITWLKQDENICDPVKALTNWALHLLGPDGGIKRRGSLRLSTVHGYITKIGRSFTNLFQNGHLVDFDSEFYEERYLELLLTKTVKSRGDTLPLLIRFHNHLVQLINIDPIESSTLYAITDQYPKYPEVGMLNECQYRRSLDVFKHWIKSKGNKQTIDVRTIRMARLNWVFMYRFGLRGGEAFHLRHRDILIGVQLDSVRIQNTSRNKTKTKAGNRLVPAFNRLSIEELQLIKSWLKEEKIRRGNNFSDADYLFIKRNHNRQLTDRRTITTLITTAIRFGANINEARPHWGRGSLISHTTTLCGISLDTYKKLLGGGALRPVTSSKIELLTDIIKQFQGSGNVENKLAWDISAIVGHASPVTTNTCYSHLIAFWENPISLALWQELNGTEQAAFAEISPGGYRKRRSDNNIDKSNTVGQVAIVIDQLYGKQFSAIYKEKFEYKENLKLPSLQLNKYLMSQFNIKSLLHLLIDMKNDISFNTLRISYDFTTDEANSLLGAIYKSQMDTGCMLLSKEIIMASYEDIDEPIPLELKLSNFEKAEFTTQLNPIQELIEKYNNIKQTQIIQNTLKAFKTGLRIRDAGLALNDTNHVRDFISFIQYIGVLKEQIFLSIEVPAINDIEKGLLLNSKLYYSDVTGVLIDNISVEIVAAESRLEQPRFVINQKPLKNKKGEIIKRVYGRSLWYLLLLIDIYDSYKQNADTHK